MEENDFVSIWLTETGNPAIEQLTTINKERADQTNKILAEKGMTCMDYAMIVDINPDEVQRWLDGRHSFSINKLNEMNTALTNSVR